MDFIYSSIVCLFFSRYLGFDKFITSSCDNGTDIRIIDFDHNLDVDSYLNPIAILLCYYTLGVTSSLLLRPKVKFNVSLIIPFYLCSNQSINQLNGESFKVRTLVEEILNVLQLAIMIFLSSA